jgi:hypothetical protein
MHYPGTGVEDYTACHYSGKEVILQLDQWTFCTCPRVDTAAGRLNLLRNLQDRRDPRAGQEEGRRDGQDQGSLRTGRGRPGGPGLRSGPAGAAQGGAHRREGDTAAGQAEGGGEEEGQGGQKGCCTQGEGEQFNALDAF